MIGTTVGIILIVVAIIITNLTLLIQAKSIRKLKKRIDILETALIFNKIKEMGGVEEFIKELDKAIEE